MTKDAFEIRTENARAVFSLDMGYWDFEARDEDGPFRTPMLGVYRSAADAAAHTLGLEIVETLHGYGDLWFFAADGSPLTANFSEEPYFDNDNTFFPGVYTLEPGSGATLCAAIANIVARNDVRAPQVQIVVWIADTVEAATKYGWSSPEAMKQGVVIALRLLPQDMQERLIYARMSDSAGLFSNIDDALRARRHD